MQNEFHYVSADNGPFVLDRATVDMKIDAAISNCDKSWGKEWIELFLGNEAYAPHPRHLTAIREYYDRGRNVYDVEDEIAGKIISAIASRWEKHHAFGKLADAMNEVEDLILHISTPTKTRIQNLKTFRSKLNEGLEQVTEKLVGRRIKPLPTPSSHLFSMSCPD